MQVNPCMPFALHNQIATKNDALIFEGVGSVPLLCKFQPMTRILTVGYNAQLNRKGHRQYVHPQPRRLAALLLCLSRLNLESNGIDAILAILPYLFCLNASSTPALYHKPSPLCATGTLWREPQLLHFCKIPFFHATESDKHRLTANHTRITILSHHIIPIPSPSFSPQM